MQEASPVYVEEARKLTQMLQEDVGYRVRWYAGDDGKGAGQVILCGTHPYEDALPEVVVEGLEVVQIEGKGRGIKATRSFKHCELVLVGYALAAAVVEHDKTFVITSGNSVSHGSHAQVRSMLAYAASQNNEAAWILSQLCDGSGTIQQLLQLRDLHGLSCRWLPMLGQKQCYYAHSDRVHLPALAVDGIVKVNAHGTRTKNETGIFPLACFFNHARDSNCAYVSVKLENGHDVPGMLAVMTSRPVQEGEELTVTYADPMPLNNAWGIRP